MTSRTAALSYSGFSCNGLRPVLLALTAISALLLGGCSIDLPSKMTPETIQLVTDNHSQRYIVKDVTSAMFDQMADHYNRFGSGEAEVIVAYDPISKKNTAMNASDQLHNIVDQLSRRGVHNLNPSIIAVEQSGDQSEMVIGYRSVSAEPPEGCGMMPGYETNQAMANMQTNYKMGCSVTTLVSRQIAHPEDLAGRAVDSSGDGRRAATVAETYRTGTRNSPLSGALSSSGN